MREGVRERERERGREGGREGGRGWLRKRWSNRKGDFKKVVTLKQDHTCCTSSNKVLLCYHFAVSSLA